VPAGPQTRQGAYGFRLQQAGGVDALRDLVELDPNAPLVSLEWRRACVAATFDSADDETASMGTRGATAFHVRRTPPSIVFDAAVEPDPDALVHPMATAPLAVLARWRGDATIHAGAFAAEDAAWALLGDREAGKSTTLGLLARAGHPVVADDLLAVHDGLVHAGPSCVDLRPDAAERLGSTRDLGVVGPRRRHRLSSPPAAPILPLRGAFLLEWGEDPKVVVERLPLAERVRVLHGLEYVGLVGPSDARQILEIASLPAWRVRRPTRWQAAEEVVTRICELASASASPARRTAAGRGSGNPASG